MAMLFPKTWIWTKVCINPYQSLHHFITHTCRVLSNVADVLLRCHQGYALSSKSLSLLPLGTLRFFHGVAVADQCLSVLCLRCMAVFEHIPDAIQ